MIVKNTPWPYYLQKDKFPFGCHAWRRAAFLCTRLSYHYWQYFILLENFWDTRGTLRYYQVNFKDSFESTQKNQFLQWNDIVIKKKYIFSTKPNKWYTKKPHGSTNNRTFVCETWGWFWASGVFWVELVRDRSLSASKWKSTTRTFLAYLHN